MRRTCGWSVAPPSAGTADAIFSPPPPRPCAAFWWRKARRKHRAKHGGQRARLDLDEALLVRDEPRHDLLDLDELLDQLASADAPAAELVKLRFFTGLTGDQAAEILGISTRSANLLWAYARAWLFEKLQGGSR
jgi:DNA-directed RNA polymerase specialized sigma24 family protein